MNYLHTRLNEFLNEHLNNYKILYRGDSIKIDEFSFDKFDNTAIFGLGLYLTDNKDVAYSYTLKNSDNDSVIARIYPSSDHYEDAKLCFIITTLLNDINNTHFTETVLLDDVYKTYYYYNLYKKEFYERYKNGIELFWLSDDYINELKSDRNKYNDYLSDRNEKIKDIEDSINTYNNIKKKYGKFIDKATLYFDQHENDYEFIYDGSEEWKIVLKSKNKGYISEFKVTTELLDHLYNANDIIPDNVKNILKRMILRYSKSDKIVSYLKKHYYYKPDTFTFREIVKYSTDNGNYELTLANFLYNFSSFRRDDCGLDKNDWLFFISEMKKIGYKGIVYNGGDFLNSPIKHNAYVIWNIDDVKRII